MTTQARQLILELLLLREKFSERDIKTALGILTERRSDTFFRELSILYESSTEITKVRQKTKPALKTDALLKKRRDNLIRGIRENSPSSRKMLSSLADKFGLKFEPDSSDEFRLIVTEKLKNFSDKELRAFFDVTRDRSTPDQGYLGLANFLIKKD
ncbi:hypothetical protein VVT58_08470 [Sphingobium sp. SJ10-10]|uniref:hypothetical protein n=1 Tax=Sphingobium sp. SJ10-10 TaxID=3114999 RepID=UPI002E18BC73|nr:hypothetical protein [Sphingobium sp. SJ10-10]